MFTLSHFFKTFYKIDAKAEHCGFFLNCCIHSAIILFAKIKQIYNKNKLIINKVALRVDFIFENFVDKERERDSLGE